MIPGTRSSDSFLFAGTRFDKKRFSEGIAKFKKKRESEVVDNPGTEPDAGLRGVRQKKQKSRQSEKVEGISVFRDSELMESLDRKKPPDRKKKEMYRQLEMDALLRKKHKIHVAGSGSVPSPLNDFEELRTRYDCQPYLLENLKLLRFKDPTPVQRQAIPVLLSGQECFACAPTGSGKTFAFLCPILMRLQGHSGECVRAVIVCPTRELAAQTRRACKKFARGSRLRIRLMTKKLSTTRDFTKLPCDVLVSTPRHLCSSIRERHLNLSSVEYLVLDESDKLFEMGLVKEVDFIVESCSNPCAVRMLFSATLPDTVEDLARTIMHDAVRIIIGRKNTASSLVNQRLVFAGTERGKLIALRQSFSVSLNPPVLVFVQTKDRARELYGVLKFDDVRADLIHSDLSEEEREGAIDRFRAGETWVLIATDVVARGMDFRAIKSVINFDFPDTAAAYIHRIGRCGRAGKCGEAVTYYVEEDLPLLRKIANLMVGSGSDIPPWIIDLPKQKKGRKNHHPHRTSVLSID